MVTMTNREAHRAILALAGEIRAAVREGIAHAARLPAGSAEERETLHHCAILTATLDATLADEAAMRAAGGAS